MKIAVGASSFAADSDQAVRLLREHGMEVVNNPYGRKLTQEETIRHLQGADGLLAGLEPLNETVFSQCPNLRAIARIGIGMDNIDLDAARRHGIKVSNTPEEPSDAVAEMTLAALLCIGHRMIAANTDMHQRIWKKQMGFSIAGCRVLVIGYGHIGRKTADLLRNMQADVMVYDKYQQEASSCTLEEGLRSADVITLHACGTEEILTKELLEKAKDGVVLLNSARGTMVNEDALYHALKSGKVSWYWGDVFWEEPYTGKLTECENAVLTPHISTYTRSCRASMEMQAVKNLLEDLK